MKKKSGMSRVLRFFTAALIVHLILLFSYGTASADKQKERIDGVAKFLIDRANNNFLYVFEMKMKSNESLKLYLPTVYSYLKSYNFQVLMQLSPDMWKKAVEKDLDELMKRYMEIINRERQEMISSGGIKIIENYLNKTGDIEFTIYDNDVEYICSLEKRYDNDHPCVPMQIEIARNYATILNNLIDKFKKLTGEFIKTKLTYTFSDIVTEEEAKIKALQGTTNELRNFLEIKKAGYVITNGKDVKLRIEKLTNQIESLKKIVALIKDYEEVTKTTNKVHITLMVIEQMYDIYGEELFVNVKDHEIHKENFDSFRKYAMMLAQIADADSAESVKAILEAYTLPPVSFGMKREKGTHITLSTYLGGSAGIGNSEFKSSGTEGYFNLVAPIGFEITRGRNEKGSLGAFLSIFDFGAAVRAQLNDEEHDLGIEDLFAPGVFFVYGFEKMPLATGVGYQKTTTAHNVFLFLAFDMPLFVIY